MDKELQSIIKDLQTVINGEPWFGRAVYELLEEIDPAHVADHPGNSGHSLLELLYHMITWTEFTVKRLEESKDMNAAETEKLDWRTINPAIHTWKKGVAAFRTANDQIIELLGKKNDSLLDEKVDYRTYDFRTLLHG
ncbi:MAG: DinB family protein, partial [Chitinophagaceae bacterium]